jgi:hypothetical protein
MRSREGRQSDDRRAAFDEVADTAPPLRAGSPRQVVHSRPLPVTATCLDMTEPAALDGYDHLSRPAILGYCDGPSPVAGT